MTQQRQRKKEILELAAEKSQQGSKPHTQQQKYTSNTTTDTWLSTNTISS